MYMCICVRGQGDVSVSERKGKGKEKSRVLGICLFGEIAKYKRYPLTRHLSLRFLTRVLLPSTSLLRASSTRTACSPFHGLDVDFCLFRFHARSRNTRSLVNTVRWKRVLRMEVCQKRGGGRGGIKTSVENIVRVEAQRSTIRTLDHGFVPAWLNERARPLRVLPRSPLPCACELRINAHCLRVA